MINGQVVAITGASSGIGRATALYLVRAGAKVVLGARHEEGLSRLTEEIKTAAGQAVYRVTDAISTAAEGPAWRARTMDF
jgi:NADP-dependent 3-hydroxy acid dehydrogenase YdfG